MDIISYILSKKYTDKSLVGAGALKGANCTIQSIESISGGHRVTFKWTLNDDTVETDTMDVMDGDNGLGVKSIDINSSNHLIVTYDDNTTHDAGLIEGDGSTVTYTQTLQSGTKIGEITIDGTKTNIFAPSGGSGGATSLSGLSDVQLSQSIGNGQALRYDSTSGKWINVPITPPVESSQLTEITLEPNRFYILSEATELDISLNVSSSLLFIQEFNFMFLSGSTPTELSLPSDVIVPDDFSIEANKIYEISIMNGLMLYNSWTPSTEEEPEEP